MNENELPSSSPPSLKRSNSAPSELRSEDEDPQNTSPKPMMNPNANAKSSASASKDEYSYEQSEVSETEAGVEADPDKKEDISTEDQEHHDPPASFGRGIIADFKRTIGTHWKEEMTNLNLKTVAVSFFLFFACISPAITFGAIYEKATKGWIGATEMITATAWCGIVYALIGGQPMMINGGTGPVLAFTEIIFKMAESIDVPFLTFNAWIGLWVCLYMLLAAFFDLNRIIKHATRFTDEIFSFLISTIFIINALGSPFAPVGIYYYFEEDHASHEKHEDDEDYSYLSAAFLSLLICLGTVQLAFVLRRAKFTPYGYSQVVRNLITDFAVVIAIIAMTLVAAYLFPNIEVESLTVPGSFAPTFSCCTDDCRTRWPDDCLDQPEPFDQRSWFVDLFDLNDKTWVPVMAAGPALLAFILVFLDDGITWHLINHPTHKLQHGDAYNYDTVIVGIMIAVNSIIGLPWLVAATVRSLNHINAMAEKSPEGKILSVQETRLTHLGIHLFCLISIFALHILELIPVPILYGVFLFMGLVSMATNQFWNRINMLFMESSKLPREPYTAYMETRRMHMFTAIQILLFGLLYAIKAIKKIAIAFPLVIACCIPIRLYLLPKIFTKEELIMIDGSEEDINAYLKANEQKTERDDSSPAGSSNDLEKQAPPDGESNEFDGLSSADTTQTDATITVGLPIQDITDPEDVNEHDQEEIQDLVPPLPSETGAFKHVSNNNSKANKRKPHRNRKKSVSCPSGALFVVPPPVVLEQAHSDSGESSTVASAEEGESRPLRRRRVKSLSCPTHQLFAEAERHMASNYFFG